jgi:hypothetical protein
LVTLGSFRFLGTPPAIARSLRKRERGTARYREWRAA